MNQRFEKEPGVPASTKNPVESVEVANSEHRQLYRGAFQRGRDRIGSVLGTTTPRGRVTVTVPNWMTLGRLFSVPFFWIGFFSGVWSLEVAATILLALGALSDLWDGKIARRWGQVTAFGDFMDPLADKLLVLSGFWAILIREDFGSLELASILFLILITLRESALTILRTIYIRANSSLVTSRWGKWKTAFQLITLLTTLTALNLRDYLTLHGYKAGPLAGLPMNLGVALLFGLSAYTSLVSGYLYFKSARESSKEQV